MAVSLVLCTLSAGSVDARLVAEGTLDLCSISTDVVNMESDRQSTSGGEHPDRHSEYYSSLGQYGTSGFKVLFVDHHFVHGFLFGSHLADANLPNVNIFDPFIGSKFLK